ncbi:hypothetical protein N9R48_00145 [Rickettsiales bacterium]|nr:hypothetical protein [Rickettsiales bacterium]
MQKDYQSPLGKMQPTKIDLEKVKKEGWNKEGILVVKIDDERLSWPEKEIIKQIGNKIYNSKNKKNDRSKMDKRTSS